MTRWIGKLNILNENSTGWVDSGYRVCSSSAEACVGCTSNALFDPDYFKKNLT